MNQSPDIMVALNNEHIRDLRSMASKHVQSEPARAEHRGAVRDALSPASR